MLAKYKMLSMFNKSIVFIVIYSFIAIIIGLILLLVDTSWIYGILVGLLLLIFTQLIAFGMYRIKTKNGKVNAVLIPNMVLLMRVVIFFAMFLVIMFAVNAPVSKETMALKPINTIAMLLTYGIPGYAYITVCMISLFGKKPY